MSDKNESFEYAYSAPTERERREIADIRKSYLPTAQQSKADRIRILDKRVRMPPRILAVILGGGGILVFGAGLTMILEWALYLWGVVVSVCGAGLMVAAHPAYVCLLTHNKQKYAAEILRLSDELLGNRPKD